MIEDYNNNLVHYNGLISDMVELSTFYNIKLYAKIVPQEMKNIKYKFNEKHMAVLPEKIDFV